mmetsp:Transcript_7053/g.7790  ORF Transcript_7053/g.7790 Transcript_7053/m.7790 type:complete len:219 (+) Transcript_7053:59-715(+)
MKSIPNTKSQLASLLFFSTLSSFSVGGLVIPQKYYDSASLLMGIETSQMVVTSARRHRSILFSTDFSSDFGSAMPEKPEVTLEEKMNQSADDFIENMMNALAEKSTTPPPELEALKEARKTNAPTSEITMKVYDLMIERAMLYDEDPDTGSLTPTGFDIPNNLDVPEVNKEFKHLYSYGMMLMKKGLLDGEGLKEIVLERLVKRTGLSPEEFDKWLGY